MNSLRTLIFSSVSRCRSEQGREALLYVFVGLIGLGVDFACFFLLTRLGLALLLAQWTAATVGFLHNHLWHHFVVFKHDQSLARTTVQTTVISVISILISGPLVVDLSRLINNAYLSKAIVIAALTVALYAIRKLYIFLPYGHVDQDKAL